MSARWLPILTLALAFASPAPAQSKNDLTLLPGGDATGRVGDAFLQFRWQKGEILTYKVKNSTTVTEVVAGNKQRFGSQVDLTKRYRVVDVDDKGVATVEYSVTAMRNEQTRPNGESLLFDSANPEKSTPGLREQLGKFVGATLAVMRIDATGRVVEVKLGPADRYGVEPPFAIVLPSSAVRGLQTWVRRFDVVLNPPLGTGEKYEAEQTCQLRELAQGKATIAVATKFRAMPEAVQERMPLVSKETQGDIVFDVKMGRVGQVRLNVDRTLENHQGAGSSYRFESVYLEHYVAE